MMPTANHRTKTISNLQRVANEAKLPTLPSVAMKLLELAEQEEPDYGEVAEVVKSDPAVCGQILKTVNSPLLGLRRQIESIENALPLLGVTMVRTLILGFHLSEARSQQTGDSSFQFVLWRRFLTQAVIAEWISKRIGLDGPTGFLGGLLQDIGMFVLEMEFGQDYRQQVLSNTRSQDITSIEVQQFGFTHAELSAAILKQWKLGPDFLNAIARHHDYTHRDDPSASLARVLSAASVGAEIFALDLCRSSGDTAVTNGIENYQLAQWYEDLAFQFRFEPQDVDALMATVSQRVEDYSNLLNCELNGQQHAEAIVEKSRSLLQEICVASQAKMLQATIASGQSQDQEIAYRDYLSGLLNRRFVGERLSPKLNTWRENFESFAMIYLDVDKFKSINDTYGHDVGDQAIIHVARWLERCTRNTDYVIRLGGDEFLVVLCCSESVFEPIGHRIANNIGPMQLEDGQTLEIELSVGGVFYEPQGGQVVSADSLIRQADQLMYSAKQTGGCFHSVRLN